MAFAYLLDPQNQYMTKSGAINTAGIIRVFDASTDDPAVTYKDFNGTANPEAIVLDNNGRCVCIADADKAFRVEVYDRYNSLMWTTSPLWCEAAGGGVQLNITELVSSDGSVDLVKTTVGSTTTWDLSVAKDSTQMLEWLKAEGYTVVETGHYLPTYSSGSMQVGEYGVALHANQYYHFTSHFSAVVSNPSDPIYDSIEVVFRTADAILYTKKFTVDCTTALPQEFEVSFDVMAGSDMEVGVFVGDIDSNTVSVGLSDMEVHRVYSGAPYIPDGIASREWVEDNYQEKLTAGANIVIEDNVISATAEPQLNADWDATSGVQEILHKPDLSVYATTEDVAENYQEKLTAGDHITIENNVISATGGNNFTTMSPVVAPPDGSGLFIQAGHGLQERVLDYMQYELPSVQVAGAEDEYTYHIISPWKLRRQFTLNTDTTDSANSTVGFFLASNVPGGLSNCVVQWSCDRNRSAYIRSKTLLVSTYSSTLRYVPCNSQLLKSNGYFFSIPLPKSVLADAIQEDSRFDVGGDWSSYTGALPSMYFSLYNTVTNQYISLPHTDGEKMAVRKEYNLQIDYTKVQGKLTAGSNITISDNVISATAEPQVNADWDATSGVSMILNKPVIPPDNVYVATYNTTTYQELSAAHAAGKVIFVVGVPSVLSAVIPMTSFNTSPAMVMFSAVIGADEYSAKIDQGIWSYNNVSIQADWNQPFALTPSYINNKPTIPSGVQLVPSATSADANKVLTVNFFGVPNWAAAPSQVQSDWDATSGMAEILHKPDLSIYAQSADLATVATTGAYSDLSGLPTIPEAQVNSDWDATSGVAQILNRPTEKELVAGDNITITEAGSTVTISASASAAQVNADWDATSGVQEILHKPDLSIYAESADLATVATTGSYTDLLDKPTIPEQVNADWNATTGKAEILNKPDLSIYAQSADLAAVATTGSYNSLTDTPVIPAAQVNSDWSATSGVAEILNKPEETTLTAGDNITITESGSTLTISSTSAPQVNADWDATSGVQEILNKPDLSVYAETSDLSSVAFSGSYSDLSNTPDLSIYAQSADLAAVATTGSYNSLTDTPTIPAAQVNSDWDATSGVQEILNKPDLVDIVAGPGIAIDNPDGNTLRVSMAADYEVELYSGTKANAGCASFTLSEYASNFDRIRFYGIGYGNTKVMYECPAPDASAEALSVCYTYYCRDADNNPWQMRMGVYTSTNGLDYSIRQAKFLYGGDTALAFGGGNTTQNPPIYRIVGIKRIAGGN